MMVRLVLILLVSCQPALAQQQGDTYSVNFISIGTGIDNKAVDQLLAFHRQFEKNVKRKVPFTIRHWGREGETDYRFDIKTLSSKQRKIFRDKIRKMFSGNQRVDLSGTL